MSIQSYRFVERRGFTLIELMIVASVLAVLAAIALPRFASSNQEAELNVLATNVRSISTKITGEYARTGAYPAAIDASWFADGEPDHPHNTIGLPMFQASNWPGIEHPTNKVLKAGVAGAYFYNPANGVFRARVSDQGSESATLDAYNKVNQSSETSLGNYGGGGGGGS